MRFIRKIFLVIILPLRSLASAESLLDSANNSYAKANFQVAAKLYENIIDAGYHSPELFFNLGNAYFKMGQIGKSILNYERAKKLSPLDEDIAFNLNLANQQTIDKIEPLPKLFLQQWYENIKNAHSEKRWSMRSIVCFALFLFFLAVFITSIKPITRLLGFWLAAMCFCLSVISFIIAKDRYSDITSNNTVVILSSSAEIRNAPSETGTKLFILHEGAVVPAAETKGDWVKIKLSKEKVGWVKKSQIEFI